MAVVDASVWVAWFQKDDVFYKQAESIIQSLLSTRERVSLPIIAFTEVAGAIKRTTKNNDNAWNAVLFMKELEPEVWHHFGELEPIATEIAVKYNTRGADAYYLAVAEITQSNLYTFDKQQQEAFDAIRKT